MIFLLNMMVLAWNVFISTTSMLVELLSNLLERSYNVNRLIVVNVLDGASVSGPFFEGQLFTVRIS